MLSKVFIIFIASISFSISTLIKQSNLIPNTSGYTVISIIKKKTPVYTQGLLFSDNGQYLYESGGLYGESSLKKMYFPALSLSQSFSIGSNNFAEGIGVCGDYLYQLTYRERVIFKYEYPTLKYIAKIPMPKAMNEGWGLANYSSNTMIATDGSYKIFFLDCEMNLAVSKILSITNGSYYLNNLNALVFAQGSIFLNVYLSNYIYKVNPSNGKVIASYNMANVINYEFRKGTLTNANLNNGYVLNGIAYNKNNNDFLITGKKWGFFYEIKFNNI